jgi:hypothetical protein
VKLNPKKCVFGVPRGMHLGFVVSERGIEANPDKILAIMDMGPIKNLKGVQRVAGCLAALSHFIAQLGERSLPLYKLMRNPTTSHGQSRRKRYSILSRTSSRVLLRLRKSQYSCTSRRRPKWSAQLWWLSEKSPGGPKRCNDQCTSSVRYFPIPRRATHKCKNLCTRSR